MQPSRPTGRVRYLLELALLAALVLVALNYQTIANIYALDTFHPSAQVAAIEGRLDLSYAGRALFARSSPQIDDKTTFNRDCDTLPHELELGCFYQGRIYILQITNPSLAPEMDVVMAHELLHAAWAQMSGQEHQTLTNELEAVYSSIATSDLKQRMADYAQSEPGERDNELHSILGTEFADLGSALEAHYALFFQDRASIVAAHATYEAVFSSQRDVINQELATIESEKSELTGINRTMSLYSSEGEIALYNSLVPRQNSLVDDINSRIAQYDQAVNDYNALSTSLDSQAITTTENTVQ